MAGFEVRIGAFDLTGIGLLLPLASFKPSLQRNLRITVNKDGQARATQREIHWYGKLQLWATNFI